MLISDILNTAQYVVDQQGQQTAVLLDLPSWQKLRHLLEELAEDERLAKLMLEVQQEEKLEGPAAYAAYMAYGENEPEYPLNLVKEPHYPEQSSKISPFDVQGIKLPVSKADILEAIQESRARF